MIFYFFLMVHIRIKNDLSDILILCMIDNWFKTSLKYNKKFIG
jgi:hypothetical protein